MPQMTVEENLFLGAEATRGGLLNKRELHRRAEAILARLGFPLRPGQQVGFLSRAEQQMVEIAKAFRAELSVLILDEPTASLTERETDQLFRLIEQVRRDGVGVIYITHRMSEIRRIGDRITVLRDGRYVATVPADTAEEELVRLMTGRVIEQIFPQIAFNPGRTVLEVDAAFDRRPRGQGRESQRARGRDRRARGARGLGQVRGRARLLRPGAARGRAG